VKHVSINGEYSIKFGLKKKKKGLAIAMGMAA